MTNSLVHPNKCLCQVLSRCRLRGGSYSVSVQVSASVEWDQREEGSHGVLGVRGGVGPGKAAQRRGSG